MQSYHEPSELIFIQSRAEIDLDLVEEYADMMADGVGFDPADAISDGARIYVWDGFHRGEAAKKAGKLLFVSVRPGTREEAEWLALKANQKHGLKRSNADKQKIVRLALLHPQGATLSDRQLAAHCGVSHTMVSGTRSQMESTGKLLQSIERTGADGRTISVANIGSAQPDYASIAHLESGVRRWLESYPDLAGRLRALGLIKARTNHGVELLEGLLTGDALPGPRRKGDVVQACNNVLDQLQQQRVSLPNPDTAPPAPTAEASEPRKILDPTGELTKQAQKICSADTLDKDRLRGVIEIEGKTYACTSAVYAGVRGYEEAHLVEVVSPENYPGPTTTYEEISQKRTFSYTGQRVGCKGKSWVMTDQRVTLRWEFEPYESRPAAEARPASPPDPAEIDPAKADAGAARLHHIFQLKDRFVAICRPLSREQLFEIGRQLDALTWRFGPSSTAVGDAAPAPDPAMGAPTGVAIPAESSDSGRSDLPDPIAQSGDASA